MVWGLWAISFGQPCVLVGLHTSRTHIQGGITVQLQAHPLDRGLWSLTMKDDELLLLPPRRWISAMNTEPKCSLEFRNNEYNS